MDFKHQEKLAYLIGVALGDGNLSNPNGRAIRLRISCFSGYPKLVEEITETIRYLLPYNKISTVRKGNSRCFDISVYSNQLAVWMPWVPGQGSKFRQHARVPAWILEEHGFARVCLKGLIQTDGCIYTDRGYQMVNFVNASRELAQDVYDMFLLLDYRPTLRTDRNGPVRIKHSVRVARKSDVARLIRDLGLYKA